MEQLKLPPAYANADPITSRLAAQEMDESGARQRQVDEVVALVRKYPGRTSMELAHLGGVDRYVVARRLPDAEHAGLVRKCEAKRCGVSGRMAVTWIAK